MASIPLELARCVASRRVVAVKTIRDICVGAPLEDCVRHKAKPVIRRCPAGHASYTSWDAVIDGHQRITNDKGPSARRQTRAYYIERVEWNLAIPPPHSCHYHDHNKHALQCAHFQGSFASSEPPKQAPPASTGTKQNAKQKFSSQFTVGL